MKENKTEAEEVYTFEDWTHSEPFELGRYWFYGERFQPFLNHPARNELVFCEVVKVTNGTLLIGGGHFMYKKEFGTNWWFKKAILPSLPLKKIRKNVWK
jgi:hypothetical protein